jgi:hypothetical protein
MRWKVRRAAIPQDVRNKFEQFDERVVAHAFGAGQLSARWPELDPLFQNEKYRAYLGPWLIEMRDLAERRDTITLFAAIAAAVIALVAVVLTVLAWRFPVN